MIEGPLKLKVLLFGDMSFDEVRDLIVPNFVKWTLVEDHAARSPRGHAGSKSFTVQRLPVARDRRSRTIPGDPITPVNFVPVLRTVLDTVPRRFRADKPGFAEA